MASPRVTHHGWVVRTATASDGRPPEGAGRLKPSRSCCGQVPRTAACSARIFLATRSPPEGGNAPPALGALSHSHRVGRTGRPPRPRPSLPLALQLLRTPHSGPVHAATPKSRPSPAPHPHPGPARVQEHPSPPALPDPGSLTSRRVAARSTRSYSTPAISMTAGYLHDRPLSQLRWLAPAGWPPRVITS
jgi:hypothetical protein